MITIIYRIIDWGFQIFQICVIMLLAVIVWMLDLATLMERIFMNVSVDFNNLKYYFLMRGGNGLITLVFLIILLKIFHKYNGDKILNKGKLYHDHCYIGYILCSKVLGYKKCSLIRVPIAMQFKLIINDTFDEYFYGETDDYKSTKCENITIKGIKDAYTSTINLVLSDTYPIKKEMLPENVRNLSTIYISRDNEGNSVRAFSSAFCEQIRNIVSNLPDEVYKINLYSTLNAKHCYWIARNVFKQGGRSNIKSLIVFPQSHKYGLWNFSEKGVTIFNDKY